MTCPEDNRKIFYPLSDVARDQTFHPFPHLPPELRIPIWRMALQYPRIVRIEMHNRSLGDTLLADQEKPSTHHVGHNRIMHRRTCPVSPLFRVSRESRDAALEFYRVRLPCWYGDSPSRSMTPGFIYFNPEFDYLQINHVMGDVAGLFHDLKTIFDPQHVGLLNLAHDENSLFTNGGICNINPDDLADDVRGSLVQTLSQLRSVFFVQVQFEGRCIYSTPGNYPINRAVPISTINCSFARLGPDPRPIGPHLRQVYIHSNEPDRMLSGWKRMWDNLLGPEAPMPDDQRLLLTLGSHGAAPVQDMQTAADWLRVEEEGWKKDFPADQAEDLGLPGGNAFGFWLFPVEPFVGQRAATTRTHTHENFWNLEAFRPDLVLSVL